MAFTGYSSSGLEYSINSDRGNNFVQNAPAGSMITGGDGSRWTKNSDGTTTITKDGNTWTVGSALGNFQNMLDQITNASDKTSARNLEYARQQQEWSANQANIANNFNAAEAAKNRQWQEYMSNTAHQREVADLKAAGLNPVLSAMNGNGAAVTSGATANANLPSGDSAKSDSSTAAVVQLLSSMLAAQTQLTNTAMSARSNEAIADKYTAMSELTAMIAANASMYGADTQYRIQQDFPSSMVRIFDSMLSGTGYGWSDIGSQIMDTALEAYDKWQGDHPTFWQTLAGKLKEGYSSGLSWLNNIKNGNKSTYKSDDKKTSSGRRF